MANGLSGVNLKSLGVLWDLGTFSGLDDREILARFIDRRDGSAELAFETLVRRHGPMVLGVCRGLLGDRHAAEDAFQAVFLVLARKARSIRRPEQLGPWLHGVALRTARESRKRDSRRKRLEGELAKMQIGPSVPSTHDPLKVEEAEALHGEIARLPERYRSVVVLCDLEGLTQQEAASRLRCPVGTVAIRLKRARERLRARLTQRGLAPLSGLLLTLPRTEIAPGLIDATVKASLASGFATASVVSLAEGVRMTMFIAKVKAAATGTILALGLTAAWAVSGGFAAAQKDDPLPSITGRAIPPEAKPEVIEHADFVGHTEASRAVELRSRLIGVVEKVGVANGARFQANDVLFEVAPKPYEAALATARASLLQAEAQRRLALAVKARNARLLQRDPNAVTQQEIDKSEADLIATTETMKTASLAVAEAEANLAGTKIRAGFDGVVLGPLAQIGDPVKPDKTILAQVAATNPIAVAFDVDERTVLKIRRLYGDDKQAVDKMTVTVGLADQNDFPHQARLESLPDRLDPATATAKFRATIPNPDQSLLIGQFVRVRLTLNDPRQPSVVSKADDPGKVATADPQATTERAIARVVTREVRDYESFPGSLQPSRREKVRARVGGSLEKVNFAAGAKVKANDLLFEIDPRPYQVKVDQAETAVLRAQAQKRLATAVKARNDTLRKKDPSYVSQEEMNKAEAELALTVADLETASQNLRLAKVALDETRIKVPVDGYFALEDVRPRDLIEADELMGTIAVVEPVVVSFAVDQARLDQLHQLYGDDQQVLDNLTVRVRISNEILQPRNEFPQRATIESLPTQIDSVTGKLNFRATASNPEQSNPGSFVAVRMWFGPSHQALLVPQDAVLTDGDRKIVYILDDREIVEVRTVQVGLGHDGFVEIRDGLKAGDRVVLEDLASLKPGMTIKPRTAPKSSR